MLPDTLDKYRILSKFFIASSNLYLCIWWYMTNIIYWWSSSISLMYFFLIFALESFRNPCFSLIDEMRRWLVRTLEFIMWMWRRNHYQQRFHSSLADPPQHLFIAEASFLTNCHYSRLDFIRVCKCDDNKSMGSQRIITPICSLKFEEGRKMHFDNDNLCSRNIFSWINSRL